MLKKFIILITIILILLIFCGCGPTYTKNPEIYVETNDYQGLISNTTQDISIKQKFTEEFVFGGGSASESWFISKKDHKLYHIHDYYMAKTDEHNYNIHSTNIDTEEIKIIENLISNGTENIDKNNINTFYIIENNKKSVQVSENETNLTDILFFYSII